jgi:hypothetical protein
LSAIFSWDTLYWLSQFILVIFAALALVSGAVVNKRQSKQLLELRTDLADAVERQKTVEISLAAARTRQVEAELALEKVKTGLGQRRIIGDKAEAFKTALAGKPKAKTDIWFEPEDGEAYFFASQICSLLREAGWEETSSAMPIPTTTPTPPDYVGLPLAMRVTGGLKSGLCVLARDLPQVVEADKDRLAIWVLFNAFGMAGKPCGAAPNKDVPEGTLRIIVGSKP